MANDNVKQLQAVLGSPFWREAPIPRAYVSSRNPFLGGDFDDDIEDLLDGYRQPTTKTSAPNTQVQQPPRPSEDIAKKDDIMSTVTPAKPALNPFGNLGLEFGPVPDDKIQMSLYGPAFRRKSGWAAYDGSQMVDVTGTTFPANGLAYKIPAKTLEKGDIILYEEHPFVVLEVPIEGGVRVLSMAGDDERVVRPKTNLLGINFFTKIECLIKLNDVFGADGKGDISQVLMMSMLGNQGGEGGLNNILPLLMLKGLGGEKDGKGGLDPMLLMLMMGGQGGPGAAGGLFGAGGQGGIGQLLMMKALLK
jgi:hypothetical protein